MKLFMREGFIMAAAALTSAAFAQASFSTFGGDTRSAMYDVSSIWFSYQRYEVGFHLGAGDGPLFINSIQLTGLSSWDAGITAYSPVGSFGYHGSVNGSYTNDTYTMGTALSGDYDISFDAANLMNSVDPSVSLGLHEFNVSIIGGTSETATDVLYTKDYKVDVLDRLDLNVTATATPSTISRGGTTMVSVDVTNPMANQDFLINTWYVSAFSNGTDYLNFDSFEGTWWGTTVAAGQTVSGNHSKWSARADQVAGLYNGNVGMVGGKYADDWHYYRATPKVTVVPEPATLAGLGLGLAFAIRRRKR